MDWSHDCIMDWLEDKLDHRSDDRLGDLMIMEWLRAAAALVFYILAFFFILILCIAGALGGASILGLLVALIFIGIPLAIIFGLLFLFFKFIAWIFSDPED